MPHRHPRRRLMPSIRRRSRKNRRCRRQPAAQDRVRSTMSGRPWSHHWPHPALSGRSLGIAGAPVLIAPTRISPAGIAGSIWKIIDYPAGQGGSFPASCQSVPLKNCGPGKERAGPQILEQGLTPCRKRPSDFLDVADGAATLPGAWIARKMLVTAFAISSYVLRA